MAPDLPERVQAALVRGIGAYLRTADPNELPPELKRLRSFRPQALAKHKTEMLQALEKGPTAALILQWTEETKPPLAKADLAILRAAAQGQEGWQNAFGDEPPGGGALEEPPGAARLREEVERQKARAAKARAGERAAKEALKEATEAARLTGSKLSREIDRLEGELGAVRQELERQRAAAAKASEHRARQKRLSEREMERERKATQEAQAALKEAKRALRERDSEIRKLKTQIGPATPATERRDTPLKGAGPPTPATTNRRKLLKAPPGLLDDDPKTLDHWLRTEKVQLLVDGYNVSKSVTGFAHLSLEDQRKRVVQAVNRLARKNGLVPIVVFDGAEAPPGLARRGRGSAVVEYSAGEIADDHLIARLVNLPSDPVVFVTNDKELQSRAQALGATIATSGQLLALAR